MTAASPAGSAAVRVGTPGPPPPGPPAAAPPGSARNVAAAGAAVAGVLHFAAALAHSGHAPDHVVFFATAGTAQLALAGLLRRPPPRAVVLAAMLGTVALIGGYVVAQLTGWPAGADPHGPDLAGLGFAVLVAELTTAAALPLLVHGRWRTTLLNLALAAGVALWSCWLFGLDLGA